MRARARLAVGASIIASLLVAAGTVSAAADSGMVSVSPNPGAPGAVYTATFSYTPDKGVACPSGTAEFTWDSLAWASPSVDKSCSASYQGPPPKGHDSPGAYLVCVAYIKKSWCAKVTVQGPPSSPSPVASPLITPPVANSPSQAGSGQTATARPGVTPNPAAVATAATSTNPSTEVTPTASTLSRSPSSTPGLTALTTNYPAPGARQGFVNSLPGGPFGPGALTVLILAAAAGLLWSRFRGNAPAVATAGLTTGPIAIPTGLAVASLVQPPPPIAASPPCQGALLRQAENEVTLARRIDQESFRIQLERVRQLTTGVYSAQGGRVAQLELLEEAVSELESQLFRLIRGLQQALDTARQLAECVDTPARPGCAPGLLRRLDDRLSMAVALAQQDLRGRIGRVRQLTTDIRRATPNRQGDLFAALDETERELVFRHDQLTAQVQEAEAAQQRLSDCLAHGAPAGSENPAGATPAPRTAAAGLTPAGAEAGIDWTRQPMDSAGSDRYEERVSVRETTNELEPLTALHPPPQPTPAARPDHPVQPAHPDAPHGEGGNSAPGLDGADRRTPGGPAEH